MFLLCLKRNVSQTFESSSCENLSPKCVCYWYSLLRSIFFVPCDNWKTLFFIQIHCYPEVFCNHHVALLRFLKQVFWKKSVFHFWSGCISFFKIQPIIFISICQMLWFWKVTVIPSFISKLYLFLFFLFALSIEKKKIKGVLSRENLIKILLISSNESTLFC